MLEASDGHAGLNPASSPVGEVVPSVRIFVDGVGRVRKVGFHHLPRPCPGEIGQVALLLHVLVAVHCAEHRENCVLLHKGMIKRVIRIEPPPGTENGPDYWPRKRITASRNRQCIAPRSRRLDEVSI